jgi:hypothetical protein
MLIFNIKELIKIINYVLKENLMIIKKLLNIKFYI